MHVPRVHNMTLRMSHMVHDDRFLAVVIAIGLLMLIAAFAVWAALAGEGTTTPQRPFYPYSF